MRQRWGKYEGPGPPVVGKKGSDAEPLPPGALVVPGHRTPSGAWRSVYRAGILGDFHRPAVISSGRAKPADDRSWAIPTRPEWPLTPGRAAYAVSLPSGPGLPVPDMFAGGVHLVGVGPKYWPAMERAWIRACLRSLRYVKLRLLPREG